MGPVERRRRRIRQRGDGDPPVDKAPTDDADAGRPGTPPPGRSAEQRTATPERSAAPARGGPAPRAGRGRRGRPDQGPDQGGGEGLRAPDPRDLAGLGGTFALTTSVLDPEPAPPAPDTRVAEESPTERGLRGLVGSGASQVRVTAAMRARDAARPTDEDLATAESELVIVRRGWVPREELPRPPRR